LSKTGVKVNCSNCGSVNPQNAKFCNQCGERLPAACPSCGYGNPQGAKFCNNCGHRLGQGAIERASSQAATDLPALSTTHAPAPAAGARDLEGERRNVTILFCDVQGSTAASERLDPEDWTEIMNGVFSTMIQPVYHFEGTVARLMGDAILAFFGAPVSHEDDPQRAVLAGLEIIAGFEAYREQVTQRWGVDINLRVGINSGLVVVGAVGSDQRTEYTAMGDAINVAARMEQTAEPGTVQIGEDTYRAVAPYFEVQELGGVRVKGKRDPVQAYRVLHQKRAPDRARGIAGLQAPLVGRDREMATLRNAVENLRQGRGQIVCLLGEAGLGKSRLIEELRKEWQATIAQEAVSGWDHWGAMGAVSYGSGDPYSMFKHQVRQYSDIQTSDPADLVRQKIAHAFSEYPEPLRTRLHRAYIQLLGALPDDGSVPILGAEDLKRELITSTVEGFAAQIGHQPTVYAFDDLHWADAASVELLQQLLRLADSHPILFLCAMRPYREAPGWDIKVLAERDHPHSYTELFVQPLKIADGEALVEGFLAVPQLPQTLRNAVLAKAEGNPFFLEEIMRTLIDQGILVPDLAQRDLGSEESAAPENGRARWRVAADVDVAGVAIPDNVRALLTARIDQLPEECRHTLQLAAVIGRSFLYRVLEAVAAPTGDLVDKLATLQRQDLVRELKRLPELEYSFRHTLTRDAAYSSILHRQRRQFHRQVGEAMERLYQETVREHAAELAQHFAEGRDDERAMRYSAVAGEEAARVFANAEAVQHYRRALALAEKENASSEELTDLYSGLGRVLELDGQFDRALATYEEMENLAQERGDRTMEMMSLMARVTVQAVPNAVHDSSRAQQLGERALDLARELGDRAAEARVLWGLSLAYYWGYRVEQAIECGVRSLALARELDLGEQIAQTLNDLGRFWYMSGGRSDQASAALHEASEIWRDLGNLPMLADSLGSAAASRYFFGEFERSIAVSGEALQISQSINNSWGQSFSQWIVGRAFWERGELSRAIATMQESIRFGELAKFVVPQAYTRADLAALYGDLGAVSLGMETARLALSFADAHIPIVRAHCLGVMAKLHMLEGNVTDAEEAVRAAHNAPTQEVWPDHFVPVPLADGELALEQGDYERALTVTDELLSQLREFGMHSRVPYVLYMQGQALLGLGQEENARKRLLECRAEAETIGSRRVQWRVLLALSQIEPDAAEAERLRSEARGVVDYIADHIDQDDLRRSFLNRPDVRVLFGHTDGGAG
jgi:class 3 adenylate cyclase/tetratricopeptide (TPR) repeat protein